MGASLLKLSQDLPAIFHPHGLIIENMELRFERSQAETRDIQCILNPEVRRQVVYTTTAPISRNCSHLKDGHCDCGRSGLDEGLVETKPPASPRWRGPRWTDMTQASRDGSML